MQGTLGKLLLKIKVIDVDGNRIDFGKASGRWLCRALLVPLTFYIGYAMILFTQYKQGLHDKASGCFIVNRTN